MTYSEIHIWGDSIGRGILYQQQKQRYAISPFRYTDWLESALGIKVCNHAVMGATALDGLARFQAANPSPGALCAIEYGGNDCDLDWAYVAEHPSEPVTAKIPLALYRQKLMEFVTAAREKGMHPLLVTPIPLHAERYFHWVTRGLSRQAVLDALGDVQHIYRWQERYAIAMRQVAQETRCRLMDLRDAFLAHPNYESLMCVDGIHPSEDGYKVLAITALQQAAPFLPKEKQEAALTSLPN